MKPRMDASDFNMGCRKLLRGRRLPFKLGVIATLAIAIGANIAVLGNLGVMFGAVVPGVKNQNLLEPYLQPMAIKALSPSQAGLPRPVYDAFASMLEGRADVALYEPDWGRFIIRGGQPQYIPYLITTASLTKVLGIQAVAGRMLNTSDSLAGAPPVIVIAARLAKSQFSSADKAVGKMLSLNGKIRTIVGVLPASLSFPSGIRTPAEAWVPIPPESSALIGTLKFINQYALMHPLVPLPQATLKGSLTNAYQQSLARYKSDERHFLESIDIRMRLATLTEREFGPVLTHLKVLEIAAVLLLLLVFANLAGLATTDALARRQEFATRTVLGAGLIQLFWERACELLILAVIGWAVGVGLGWFGSHALAVAVGQAGMNAVFSTPVLLVTLGAVIIIALLLSLAGIRRVGLPEALAVDIASGSHIAGGRVLAHTLRTLVVFQLAASLILLLTAAHLQSDVFALKHGDLGFTPAGRTFIGVALPGSNGDQTETQYQAYDKQAFIFDQTLIERMQVLPGVKAAALLSLAPLSPGDSDTTDIRIAPNSKSQIINLQAISRQIVPALGLRVLAGNPNSIFNGSESSLLLDVSAVHALWPEVQPVMAVGRHVYTGGKTWQVAAVVKPLRMRAYGAVGGTIFQPLSGPHALAGGPQRFVINSGLSAQILRTDLAKLVQQVNPQAKLVEYRPAGQMIAQAYAARDRLSKVFGAVALVTLVIAAVGLFALFAYRALVRRSEFAIRGAMGATPMRLFTYILTESVVLWIIGCVIGLPLAYVLSAELALHLPKLGSIAPWVAVTVTTALGVASLVAAVVPALRVARTQLAQNLQQ